MLSLVKAQILIITDNGYRKQKVIWLSSYTKGFTHSSEGYLVSSYSATFEVVFMALRTNLFSRHKSAFMQGKVSEMYEINSEFSKSQEHNCDSALWTANKTSASLLAEQ
jgi:formylmethanofuran dehydrogenase subunit E-like metal-binding protein